MPAAVTSTSTPPSSFTAVATIASLSAGVRRVDRRERGAPAHRLDLGDGLRAVLLEDVGDEHVGAFVGQAEAARTPDAVAAAGDDRDLSLETSHLRRLAYSGDIWLVNWFMSK